MRITFSFVLLVTVFDFSHCDVQTNLGCDPAWYASTTNNACYYIETTKQATRAQAAIDCGNKQANLFRFSDVNELTYLQSQITQMQGDGFWTDLTDLRFDGTMTGTGLWQWGQYQTLDNSTIPWEVYPTSTVSEACGALNYQGKFVNLQCSRQLGFICKIDGTANTGCPPGWMVTDPNSCFFFSNTRNASQLKTFAQAQAACQAMAVPQGITTAPHLLTLKSQDDVNYLQGQIPYLAKNTDLFWTGLQRQGSSWGWANNDPFGEQLINWAVEPDHLAGNEHCGIIKPDGKFADQDCSKTFNYICVKGTTIVDPSYFFGCGGWERAGHKCYMFYDGPQTTFSDASSRCQSLGSRLLKVESKDEKRWLEWQMSMPDLHPNGYWSGLNDRATEGDYRWTDNTKSDPSLIRWNAEPNDWLGNEDCASIMAYGVYNDMGCDLSTGFICEYINILYNPASGQPVCQPGWVNWPNSRECYYFSPPNASLTWDEANDYCHNVKIQSANVPTTLLAVNGAEEKAFIEQQLTKVTIPKIGFWTSLNDKTQEGTWLYYDDFNNPPNPDLIKWGGEPTDDGTMNEDCSIVLYGGRYYDQNCADKYGFICERYAAGYTGNRGAGNSFNLITLSVLTIATTIRQYAI